MLNLVTKPEKNNKHNEELKIVEGEKYIISSYMADEQIRVLKEQAEKEDISLACLIRHVLKDYIKSIKASNKEKKYLKERKA